MILFNLLLFKDNPNYLRNSKLELYNIENRSERLSKSAKKSIGLAYMFKTPDFLSDSNKDIAKKNLMKQSLKHKFFSNLWAEEAFLSINNKSLDKYNKAIKLTSINKNHNLQKSLVSTFSKSLSQGLVQSSLVNNYYDFKNNLFDIQYSWTKILQLYFLNLGNIAQINLASKDLKHIDNILEKRINLKHLPLFVVSNHLGQMIIAEPPIGLNSEKYTKQMYHGFVFTNCQDAQEYMLYVQRYYSLESNSLRISNFNFLSLNKLIKKFNSKICFKLIPDLKEVSELIKKYRYYRNVSFHKNQKYGKNYFQGQPLYFVKYKRKNLYYSWLQKQDSQQYNLLFTNYANALYICQKLKNQTIYSKIEPLNITVYNLEQFIQDQLNSKMSDEELFLIVPSSASYLLIKESQKKEINHLIYNTSSNLLSSIILWSKRVFWSLTSKKP